jgi:hypothetical protein
VCDGACAANPALPLESVGAGILEGNRALVAEARALDRARAPSDRPDRLDRPGLVDLAGAILRGQGRLCGRLVRRGIPADEERARATWRDLSLGDRTAFSAGYGAGLAEGGDGPAVSSDMLDVVEAPFRATLWLGFGASLRRLYGADAPRIARTFESDLADDARAALERGTAGLEGQGERDDDR